MISLAREKAAETKTTLTQLSVKGGDRGEGAGVGSFFFSPDTQDPISLQKKPPCAWQPWLWRRPRTRAGEAVKPAWNGSWPRGCHPPAWPQELWGPPLCPPLCMMQIVTQHRTLGPQEGKTHRRPHPSSSGKFWASVAILWRHYLGCRPKNKKNERRSLLENVLFRGLEGQDFVSDLI